MKILLLSNVQHRDTPTSQLHLGRALAERHQVLYVDTLGNRGPGAGGKRDLAKVFRRLLGFMRGAEPAGGRLRAVSPLALPGSSGAASRLVDGVTLLPQIRHALRVAGAFPPDVVWVASPSSARIARGFDTPVVYYCTDDTASFPAVDRTRVLADEMAVIEGARLVIAVSETLAETLRARGANEVVVVPNGVQTELFAAPSSPAVQRARELAGDGPFVLLAGTLDDRTDLELLGRVVRAMPSTRFVVAGPRMPSLRSEPPQAPNLRYLGTVEHEVVAGLASLAAACIAPYADTDVVRQSSPLKVMEYLAAGRPVVASAVRPLLPYAGVVALADGAEAFADAIRTSIESDEPSAALRRQQRVADCSWSQVAARVEALLYEVVGGPRR